MFTLSITTSSHQQLVFSMRLAQSADLLVASQPFPTSGDRYAIENHQKHNKDIRWSKVLPGMFLIIPLPSQRAHTWSQYLNLRVLLQRGEASLAIRLSVLAVLFPLFSITYSVLRWWQHPPSTAPDPCWAKAGEPKNSTQRAHWRESEAEIKG